MPVSVQDIKKPKFDPSAKFEPVDSGKPAFNPNGKFEAVPETVADLPNTPPATTETASPRFPKFVNPSEFIQPSEKQPIVSPNINPNSSSVPTMQDLHDQRVKEADNTIPKLLDTKEANAAIDKLAQENFQKTINSTNTQSNSESHPVP